MGLIVATVMMAQPATKSVTINSSDIEFWVGSGSNSTVVAIGWDATDASYTPTVVVWGLHWNGSITLLDALDSVATYDSRFTYTMSGAYLQSLDYNDPTTGVHLTPYQYWNCNNYNGVYGSTTLTSTWLRISESTCDDYNFTGVSNLIYASDPNPEDATIEAEDLTYWVGEGPFETVFVINWPDTALAWGYRFSARSTNLQNVMNDIAAADPRLTFVTGSYGIDDILFVENGDTLRKAAFSWWEHSLNGAMSAGLYQQINDGDFSRWADPTAGVLVDSTYDTNWNYWMYTYAYPQRIYPVSAPTPTDATIGAEDIRYWVGDGENEVVFVVNWPDSALAWGYRFNGDATVQDAMNDIAAADSRFAYTTNDWGVDDILFIENGDTLRKASYSWWEHSLNGAMSAGMYQPLNNGDFSRWADPTAGVLVDSTYNSDWDYWMYTYAYPQTIYPASAPEEPEVGPFCGAVGSEGCTAVACNDPRIKGWATACTVERGSSNLLDPDAAPLTFGTEAEAVGPATTNTMDVVSLGDGGSATLTFDTPIANGDGYDFAVFENSFNDFFLELAVVEVSSDGERFVRFPATSLTQTHTQIDGNGRVDPTFINNLAGKYRVGYGTPFDLEELRDSADIDINHITHVRVIDVVGSIDPQYGTYDAFGHLINDPFPTITYSAGFDLDGVAILNNTLDINTAEAAALKLYPNPASSAIWCELPDGQQQGTLVIYNTTGKEMKRHTLTSARQSVRIETLPDGVYFVSITTPQGIQTSKLIIRH